MLRCQIHYYVDMRSLLLSLSVLLATFCSAAQAATAPPVPPQNIAAPTLSVYLAPAGTVPSVGSTLVCDPGTWTENPHFTYKWYRGVIEVSSGPSYYKIQPHDALNPVACEVTAHNGSAATIATVSTAKILPPIITSLSAQLLLGTGTSAHLALNCGNILSRACKVVKNTGAAVSGVFIPKDIDRLPMNINIQKRVPTSTGGWRWTNRQGVEFTSNKGYYSASIKSALSIQPIGQYRVRTRIEASWAAQAFSSKYVYITLLPALAR